MDKTVKIILIAGIVAILIVGVSMFFTGRASKGNQLQRSLSDIVRDVKGITKQMESGLVILNTAVNDLGTNSEQLDGIAQSIEQYTTDISQRIDSLENDVSGKFDGLDKSIERTLNLNKQNTERLNTTFEASAGMDEYIKRITGYIKSVDERTTTADN